MFGFLTFLGIAFCVYKIIEICEADKAYKRELERTRPCWYVIEKRQKQLKEAERTRRYNNNEMNKLEATKYEYTHEDIWTKLPIIAFVLVIAYFCAPLIVCGLMILVIILIINTFDIGGSGGRKGRG